MAKLDEWIVSSPYTVDEIRHIDDTQAARQQSGRFVDSKEHGLWLIEKAQSFMKGTWLEQHHVPWTTSQGGIWEFGFRSGPVFSFETAALHEVAHAIQLKRQEYNVRVKHPHRRFQEQKSSTQTVFGQRYYEPVSMEVALCEAEANGIQLVLLEMLGYEINREQYYQCWASIAQYLPDWICGGKQREEIIGKAIEMYYLVWKSQPALMEQRYKNYCTYVGKLREKHPEMTQARIAKAG